MAIYGQSATLLDMMKRLDPNNKVETKLIEMMNQQNEILLDMAWMEGNLPTGHKTTIRTGLPGVTWRQLYQGVMPTKSVTTQVTDTCGMLEAYSEVDKKLADLNGNAALYRMTEDAAFLESMNQQLATTLFYGDTNINPERFVGFAPRFNTVVSTTAKNAVNVIDAGGTGSTNTSMWIVCWGDMTAHGIFPKGTKAGFSQQDLGEVTALDQNQGRFQAYRTHYEWNVGLTVRDWRQVVRIANIDVTALTADASAGAKLLNNLVAAYFKLYNPNLGTPVIYANQTVRSYLTQQAYNKANAHLSVDDVTAANPVLKFMQRPIRRVDALLNTESRIV